MWKYIVTAKDFKSFTWSNNQTIEFAPLTRTLHLVTFHAIVYSTNRVHSHKYINHDIPTGENMQRKPQQFSAQLSFWVPSVKRLNWFRIFPNKSLNNYRITLTENKIEIDLVHQKKTKQKQKQKTVQTSRSPASFTSVFILSQFFKIVLVSFYLNSSSILRIL